MSNPELPSHAEHIGSLIRPPVLSQALADAEAQHIAPAELRAVQKREIARIVQAQQQHGVPTLSSGEFDRKYYFGGFFERLGGFRTVEPVPWELARQSAPPVAMLKQGGQRYPMAAVCDGKIVRHESPYLENWLLLRDAVPREQWGRCKFTMPPPCYFHLRLAAGSCYSKDAYASDEDFFADLTRAYRQEIKTLYDEGLRNLQIDDPTLAYFCSDEMLEGLRKDGEDPEKMFDMYLKAHNDCIADRPKDMHVGLHVCRGNFSQAMHFSEGSYEAIAERFFKTLDYDTFYLEYDNPRSGGFEPLRYLPPHKNVVLGVVTTKASEMENAEVIRSRVHEAAEIIAQGQGRGVRQVMQNIGISPQCGFASVASGGADGMTEERMFAKLKLVQDIAQELWPDSPSSTRSSGA